MATLTRVGQVEERSGQVSSRTSRVGWIHLVGAVVVLAIAIAGVVMDAPTATFLAVGASIFMALSARFWFAERR